MDNANNSAIILGLNKKAQVEVLRELGFSEVNDNTPMEEIVGYMKWAGGLRDLQVAAYLKTSLKDSAPQKKYFSQNEWQDLTLNEKSRYVPFGVAIRAECRQFVFALTNAAASGSSTFIWGPQDDNIPELRDYSSPNVGLYDDFDGEGKTDVILAYGKAQGKSFPAAEAARGFKAFTKAADATSVDDPTKWSLPSLAQLRWLYKYRVQLDRFLKDNFGNSYVLTKNWYWSSCEWSASIAWNVNVNNGSVNIWNSKGSAGYVRPVCAY